MAEAISGQLNEEELFASRRGLRCPRKTRLAWDVELVVCRRKFGFWAHGVYG